MVGTTGITGVGERSPFLLRSQRSFSVALGWLASRLVAFMHVLYTTSSALSVAKFACLYYISANMDGLLSLCAS